jgi:hypothetical protein
VTRKKYSNVPGGPIKKTLSLNQVCAYWFNDSIFFRAPGSELGIRILNPRAQK